LYIGGPEATNKPVNIERSSKDIFVFISYAREDAEAAKRLYDDLKGAGLNPWLDKERLLPGQNWREEISREIIEKSRYFIPLFSSTSVRKMGVVQSEIKQALAVFEKYPPGMTFIIPVRLDKCEIPYRQLRGLEYVDFFPSTNWELGLRRILQIILNKPIAVVRLNKSVVKPGEIVTLYGDESTDPSGQKLQYYWEEIPKKTIALSDQNSINPQFTVPMVDHETVFTFRLKVTNVSRDEDSATIQIRVKPIRPSLSIFPSIGDDPNLGISFEYPSDWLKNTVANTIEISPPKRNEIPISISQKESSLDISLPVKFEIYVRTRNSTTDSLSYYANDLISRITQTAKYRGNTINKIIHDKDVKLNPWLDNPAHRIQLRIEYPVGIQEHDLLMVAIDKLNVYAILYSAGETNYDYYLDTIEKIIDSIRFL
jgi:TIR domain